jgi:serine/threonine-protein kinase RsbW
MPLGIELDLVLPRDNATVPLVRHILRHTLTEFGVSAECVGDVELAVTEAAANVIEHTAGDSQYKINVSVDERECVIRVTDDGAGFDQKVPEEYPEGYADSGRGLLLMQGLMDSLTFESEQDEGTVVRLVKRLEFDVAPLRPARPVPPHAP